MRFAAATALAGLAVTLAGCTVGPDYAGPPSTPAARAAFARAGDAPVTATAPLAQWWKALGDPTLDAIVARALAANPDVAVADARLRQARTALRLERANQLPTASATALYAHARLSGLTLDQESQSQSSTTDLNLYNAGFDASWEVDLFGAGRRRKEAARADVATAEANLADAQVSLTAEVAQAYVDLRDRQLRIALNMRSVAMQTQMLALTRDRFARGTASRLDVVRLQQQLDATRADIVPLRAELESYLDALATLTGDGAGTLDATLGPVRPGPLPPAEVAIGDPAGLIRRRPDIRAAERTLAADTARIGVAEAARFPRLSFMGIIGIGGTKPSDLTDLDDFSVLAAPQLSWSFLDFGRNKARVGQAEATRDEAAARYRGAVLTALRDVEGALSRFRYGRITVATLARAQASADEAAALSRQRYRAGTTTLIDLLDAQRQQIQAEQNLSLARAELVEYFVAIHKALGLGWSA